MATPKCDFYVYMYFRSDGTPLYVGKGRGTRWKQHTANAKNTNSHFRRILAQGKAALPVLKIREGLTDEEAKATEIALIKAIGRRCDDTGPLVNMTDGGDGKAGYVTPEETRALIREKSTGRRMSDETRAVMSAARLGVKMPPRKEGFVVHNKGKKASDEAREKMRVSQASCAGTKSEKIRAFHASMTPEQKAARAALISKTTKEAMTPDVCAVISASRKGKSTPPNKGHTGQPNSPETRAKISAAWQRKYAEGYVRPKHTEETKAKMSASQQRNAEAKRNGHD